MPTPELVSTDKEDRTMSGKEKTITDEQWEAVEALIPLIGKQKEWEVSG